MGQYKEKNEYKLMEAQTRLLSMDEFGILLMYLDFVIDKKCESICTDGESIFVNPDFIDSLNEQELDYVLMHEILHIVLGHGVLLKEKNDKLFERACDILVNSILLRYFKGQEEKISLHGLVRAHKAPNGIEGRLYTEEEIYEMLKNNLIQHTYRLLDFGLFSQASQNIKNNYKPWDNHSLLKNMKENKYLIECWEKRISEAFEIVENEGTNKEAGLKPILKDILIKKFDKPQTDWKSILNDFIQEDINDYSFSPPDRRYDNGDLFLPDYNQKDDTVENILFMIDTSGSMDEKAITAAYSEIKGAIDQFDGKLKGWLGFFDAAVVEPKPFENEDEFKIVKPKGGGGTSFHVIFEYVKDKMMSKLPSSIIIFTDGYASFPEESDAMGVPVLWLIDNEDKTPPWGKVARFKL